MGRHSDFGDAVTGGHGGHGRDRPGHDGHGHGGHGHGGHGHGGHGHGGHGHGEGGPAAVPGQMDDPGGGAAGRGGGDAGGGDAAAGDAAAGSDRATVRLDGRSGGVDQVRRLAVRMLAGTRWEPAVDDVRLVLSELTTNALLHGAAPIEVRILTGGASLRVEVSDSSQTMPLRPPAGGDGLTGRGMTLVAASATRWGVQPVAAGKIVWAEFAGDGDVAGESRPDAPDTGGRTPPGRARAGGAARRVPARRPDTVGGVGATGSPAGSTDAGGSADNGGAQTVGIRGMSGLRGVGTIILSASGQPTSSPGHLVRLGDVPTDLLLAAKHHVDGLVREFALAASGAASGASAAVPERLAELLGTVTTRFTGPRQAIKRQALAASSAGRPRTPLELVLPLSTATDAEQYLAALEEIEDYARAARLLTVESPPQHVAFRRWYIGSLVEQLRAAERGEGTVTTRSFEQYLLDTLDVVVAAQRIAERSARLQRVTAALARATTPEQVAAAVVSQGAKALGASGGVLMVPQGSGRLAIPGAVGYGESMIAALRAERLDDRLPAMDALRSGEPVWLESRRERDARYPDLAELEPTAVSMCVLPLFVGDRTLGALRFSFDHSRLFDDDERTFVQALATQTALALERARLFTVEREARERTALFAAATDLFTSTLDTRRILEHLVALLVPWHAGRAAACRFDEEGGVEIVAVTDRADPPPTVPAQDPSVVPVHASSAVPARGPSTDPLRGWRGSRAVPDSGGMTQALRTGRPVRSPDGTRLALPMVLGGRPVAAVGLVAAEGHAYEDDEQRVVAELVDRATVAIGNARQYEQERRTAVTLQRSLLPQRLPEIPGLAFAWRYLPGSAGALVGGDWYDVLPLDDGRIALVIGDVMGHGIHAAAAMGQLRAAVRAHAVAQTSPAVVLTLLDAAANRLEQGRIATAAFALLDPDDGRLVLASAGHLPPLLIPPKAPARYLLVEPGPPLSAGLPDYPETELQVEPGSTLLFFTDGLVEDRGRPVDEGMELLRAGAAAQGTPEEVCDRALAALGRDADHEDDTALLAVRLG
ncbi:SpoIIE family protein phosphatase [Frankia sp. QA3]|uniref:SpoIIE family protein phosphatase n=1 Tax=Frankia sp. QA3 TaxID=710111 RepID=UPI000269BDDE|nr:SpoIIE family protein phosphatase [Frankia sp. QA3]EIV92330.1 serine phosphatase RsbU, regulator of sigma subunit [Frankia sp. QA3]